MKQSHLKLGFLQSFLHMNSLKFNVIWWSRPTRSLWLSKMLFCAAALSAPFGSRVPGTWWITSGGAAKRGKRSKQIKQEKKECWILSPLSQLWARNGNSWLEECEGKALGFPTIRWCFKSGFVGKLGFAKCCCRGFWVLYTQGFWDVWCRVWPQHLHPKFCCSSKSSNVNPRRARWPGRA